MVLTQRFSIHDPETDDSHIFLSEEASIRYLLYKNYIPHFINCVKCATSEMGIERYAKDINKFIYKCKNRQCRSTKRIFDGCLMERPKIKVNSYLKGIFKWIENGYEKDTIRNLQSCKKIIQGIKQNINLFLAHEFTNYEKLGEKESKFKSMKL